MSKIDTDKLIKYIDDNCELTCFMCGSRMWGVTDKVFELRELSENRPFYRISEAVMPIIPVTCRNCGNTIFISALSTGLYK